MLQDKATRSIETIQKSNAQNLQEIEAECLWYNIKKHKIEETAQGGEACVEEICAMAKAKVALKKILGNKRRSTPCRPEKARRARILSFLALCCLCSAPCSLEETRTPNPLWYILRKSYWPQAASNFNF